MRPLVGSTASTDPFSWPNASIATARTTGSSYSTTSSFVGSLLDSTTLWVRWLAGCVAGRAAGCAGCDERRAFGTPVAAPELPAKSRHRINAISFMWAGACRIPIRLMQKPAYRKAAPSVRKPAPDVQLQRQQHFLSAHG